MNLDEFRAKLQQDPEYVKIEERLRPLLNLANQVLRLRLQKGWSQTELARHAGTKQSNISRLERGEANPTYDFLNKVADAFDRKLEINLAKKSQGYQSVIDFDDKTEDNDDGSTLIRNWPTSESSSTVILDTNDTGVD
jgi:transcriptional regulator with XRE-family HTH domain